MSRKSARRHPWLLPLIFAAAAAGIVYAFDVDLAHAAAIIAAAAVLGLCNDIAEGLDTVRLEPEKLRPPEAGLTDLQFLAYSLATGNRPIGDRAYLRFRTVALRRVGNLGPEPEESESGAGTPVSGAAGAPVSGGAAVSPLLRAMLTDPKQSKRSKRMTRQQLSICLDELDVLGAPAEIPKRKQQNT